MARPSCLARDRLAPSGRAIVIPIPIMIDSVLRLCDLALQERAVVDHIAHERPSDPIAARLRDLGFVQGEPIRLTARGPFGASPLLVAIGATRFALRRQEAARVMVKREVPHG